MCHAQCLKPRWLMRINRGPMPLCTTEIRAVGCTTSSSRHASLDWQFNFAIAYKAAPSCSRRSSTFSSKVMLYVPEEHRLTTLISVSRGNWARLRLVVPCHLWWRRGKGPSKYNVPARAVSRQQTWIISISVCAGDARYDPAEVPAESEREGGRMRARGEEVDISAVGSSTARFRRLVTARWERESHIARMIAR